MTAKTAQKGAGPGGALIRHKKQVNPMLGNIRARMLLLKRIMNGFDPSNPNNRVSIKEPLPSTFPQIAQQLKTDVTQALDEAVKIFQEQQGYSQQQQQKAQQRAQIIQFPQQQMQRAAASNVVTRWLAHLKALSPFTVGEMDRWDRLKILRALSRSNSLMKDIENEIVTRGTMSIPRAVYLAMDLARNLDSEVFSLLRTELEQMKGTREAEQKAQADEAKEEMKDEEPPEGAGFVPMPSGEEPMAPPPPTTPVVSEYEKAQQVKRDFGDRKNYLRGMIARIKGMGKEVEGRDLDSRMTYLNKQIGILSGLLVGYSSKRNLLERGPGKIEPKDIANQVRLIQTMFSTIEGKVNMISQELGILPPGEQPEPQPEEVQPEPVEDEQQADDDNSAIHTFVSRYLKRKNLEMRRDRDRALRLEADRKLRVARNELNKMMDIMESPNAQFKDLLRVAGGFASALSEVYWKPLYELAGAHTGRARLDVHRGLKPSQRASIIGLDDRNSLKKTTSELKAFSKEVSNFFDPEKSRRSLEDVLMPARGKPKKESNEMLG
jgi:hypothetical protein